MTELKWITEARKYLGLAEVIGPEHNRVIIGWLVRLRAWWKNDETPWCGVYVAQCIESVGYELPRLWMQAKDWLNWGVALPRPVYGCVVVFERKGGGHVGFVVGLDKLGNLMVLGGNQGNKVSIAPFDRQRVVGYRWPKNAPAPEDKPLPILTSNGKLSTNEA